MIQLKADTASGVHHWRFDPDSYDVLGDEDFLQALATCQDSEVLYGVVNPHVYHIIEIYYGVFI